MIKLNIKQESRVALTLDGGRYHIETSPLICRANQWTGFCMITASIMKELKLGSPRTFQVQVQYILKSNRVQKDSLNIFHV